MATNPTTAGDAGPAELRLEELEARARRENGDRPLSLRDWLALAEGWRIARALRDARGNRSRAARELRIGRRTLYTKMEKLGLTPVWLVAAPAAVAPDGAEAADSTRREATAP
jgi:DNA-binding NtrC family response regulator